MGNSQFSGAISPNNGYTSKARISRFVHDAADMEKREYILRGIAPRLYDNEKSLRRSADEIVEKAKSKTTKLRDELSSKKVRLKNAEEDLRYSKKKQAASEMSESKNPTNTNPIKKNEDEYNEYKKKLEKYAGGGPDVVNFKLGTAIGMWFPLFGFCTISYVLLCAFLQLEVPSPEKCGPILVVVSGVMSCLIQVLLMISSRRDKENYSQMVKFVKRYEDELLELEELKENIKSYIDEIDEYKSDIKKLEDDIIIAEKEQSLAEAKRAEDYKKADWIHSQADNIIETANIIRARKLKLYEIGIVPPDYRTLDATLMIANIFDNDLADTMREAILLYDERVFRGDVVRGIDNINRSLGQLNITMGAVLSCLNDIRASVNSVSRGLLSMGDKFTQMGGKILDEQKRTTEEARAMRYATEELNESQEIMNRYIEDKRNGFI